MTIETRIYRLTGRTPMLGSQPASKQVRRQWIAERAVNKKGKTPEEIQALIDEENKLLGVTDQNNDLREAPTCFLRDDHNGGRIFIYDYVVKGFFKGALEALKGELGVAAYRGKVDRLLFVGPRILYIMRDGEPLIDEDGFCQRSLRADTPQGPKTALAESEMVNDPWEIEFELALIPNEGTARSKPLTWEAIETCLDYGKLSGLSQWRNAGYGRFTWERLEKLDPDAGREAGGSFLTDQTDSALEMYA